MAGCLAGALLAAVPFVWMLNVGRLDLTQRHPLGGFYDAQAQSLLDLRWDVPEGALGTEAFMVDGKSYQYQGPVPALLRLPVVALTDRYDGRLTQLSMLGAFAATMFFATSGSRRRARRTRGAHRTIAPSRWNGGPGLAGAEVVAAVKSSAELGGGVLRLGGDTQ